MGMLAEFKEFAVKGNVMDMAVGIIIGGAFGKIVSSLVADVIMPVVGLATGGVNFTDKFTILGATDKKFATLAEAKKAGVAVLGWGQFVQNIFDFLVIAFCIFMMIKWMNKMKNEEPAPEPEPEADPADVVLLREIRDALKKG